MKFNGTNMQEVVRQHKKWLESGAKYCSDVNAVSCADFGRMIIYGATLNNEDLRYANFSNAKLIGVGLCGADLRHAVFRGTEFKDVWLDGANLDGVYFADASFENVHIRGTKLDDVDFSRAKNTPFIPMICPDTGSFIGWKGALVGHDDPVIIKLLIPEGAKRSSGVGRKCRCDKAIVLEIQSPYEAIDLGDSIEAYSMYDNDFKYRVGNIITPDLQFNENRWIECASGIHFFINRQEAVDYIESQM